MSDLMKSFVFLVENVYNLGRHGTQLSGMLIWGCIPAGFSPGTVLTISTGDAEYGSIETYCVEVIGIETFVCYIGKDLRAPQTSIGLNISHEQAAHRKDWKGVIVVGKGK